MRYGNPQPEAPTYLGSHQLPLPPEWLPAEEFEDDDDGPTRAARGRRTYDDPVPTRHPTERSASPLLLEHRIERPHPDDVRRESKRSARGSSPTVEGKKKAAPETHEERQSFVASGEVETSAKLEEKRRSRSSSRSRSSDPNRESRRSDASRESRRSDSNRDSKLPKPVESQSAPSASSARSVPSDSQPSARGSQPQIPVGPAPGAPPVMGAAGPGAQPLTIDPLAVPVPPELGGPIYGWIRRLALQADLQGADKLLREAFIDLTSSLAVAIVYPGSEGLWSLGDDGEIPKEATPIVAVAQARRAMIAAHTALIPVVTSTETVAVAILTRNPRNPGYHPIEQVAAVALARESAAILHHLAVAHLQRASEIKADQGGLYRGEALEAHRTRGNEGVPVNLSPSWVKRAYPFLVVTILVALLGSIFITVPTYSSGTGVIVLQGAPITAPTAGTVDQVLVKPGQQVQQGTVLVRLHSAEQDAELRSAQTDADNATTQYLFDGADETVRKTLIAALVRVDREKARVESRLVRARTSGTVSDIRVRVGALLQPGDPILQIVDPKAEPEMWAFLPGKDRPRLRPGQKLQIEILGYTKTREKAALAYVSPEVFGPTEVAKIVGASLADSVKLPPGGYVWVKAKMPSKTFKTQHQTLWYHHGMVAKTEVKIQSKPFLVTLLPSLEKYLPD